MELLFLLWNLKNKYSNKTQNILKQFYYILQASSHFECSTYLSKYK